MAAYDKKQSEKILTIKKGQELKIAVSDDMRSPASFMHTAFRQAICAVDGIVCLSNQFYADDRKNHAPDMFDDLFQYCGNIIAFSGPRGAGKTSTMLSFAKLLGEGQLLSSPSGTQPPETESDSLYRKQLDRLKGVNFIPLSPIAPSMLRDNQSILAVVLSRLYSFVSGEFLNNHNIKSSLRQNVSRSFQSCLSGLRGIKTQLGEDQEDFAMLQNVSDGMSLRASFCELIQNILQAIQNDDDRWRNTYLVLQLDDADSQIRVGYEVLEDLRKYLILPNIIILISADFDMLRRVVVQHYLSEFPNLAGLNSGQSLTRDLSKVASKYIDKLIPPSNMICLPKLDSILLRWGSLLKLRYGTKTELQEENVSLPLRSLQADVLDRIFQKTGIIFVPSSTSTRPHDILPTTLRGINQLLYLLENMKDLPPFIPDEKNLDRRQPAQQYLDQLKDYIKMEYLPVAETNLQLFSNYFVQEWINSRILDASHRDFLVKMANTTTDKVYLALDYLRKKYNDTTKNPSYSVVFLNEIINNLQNTNCNRDDLSFFFAIRMLITLDNHMWVLQQKRASLGVKAEGAFRPYYFGNGSHILYTYSVREKEWNAAGVAVVFPAKIYTDISGENEKERYYLLARCLRTKDKENKFNFVNIINFFLRLTELSSITVLTLDGPSNTERFLHIYLAQEAALRIASNWDMWDVLRYAVPPSWTETQSASEEMQLSKIFAAIDNVLRDIVGDRLWDTDYGINQSWNRLCESMIMDHSATWQFIKSRVKLPSSDTSRRKSRVNRGQNEDQIQIKGSVWKNVKAGEPESDSEK